MNVGASLDPSLANYEKQILMMVTPNYMASYKLYIKKKVEKSSPSKL